MCLTRGEGRSTKKLKIYQKVEDLPKGGRIIRRGKIYQEGGKIISREEELPGGRKNYQKG